MEDDRFRTGQCEGGGTRGGGCEASGGECGITIGASGLKKLQAYVGEEQEIRARAQGEA